MLSTPLIVTPMWPSICKPKNSLEVSRIAGFYTDISKKYKFLGSLFNTTFNTTPPVKVLLTQCKSLHYSYNTKNVWYINAPVHIALYILRLRDVFFFYFFIYFFLAYPFFGKKIVPQPFVTELHNYGWTNITSLNEMLTCSWDKHTHVFSSQLAPSIRFYILWNKKK